MDKQEQLKSAIENVSHHAWDAFIVIAGDKLSNEELITSYGTIAEVAALIADFVIKNPEIAAVTTALLRAGGIEDEQH